MPEGTSGSAYPGPVTVTWPDLQAEQQPSWAGTDALAAATAELRTFPDWMLASASQVTGANARL